MSLANVSVALLDMDADAAEERTPNPAALSLAELADHIVTAYHQPLQAELAGLAELFAHVVARHGEQSPELVQAEAVFKTLRHELEVHMVAEETWLFPICCEAERQPRYPVSAENLYLVTNEHESVGQLLKSIRQWLADYALPEGACRKRQVLYHRLRKLEADLHRHIHLENNILLPKLLEKAYVFHQA